MTTKFCSKLYDSQYMYKIDLYTTHLLMIC